MTLSTDIAAAQLMYFTLATDLTDSPDPAVQTRNHEMVRKFCAEFPSPVDLLWLIQGGYWKLLAVDGKLMGLSESQTRAVHSVQNQWLKILDHHGAQNLSRANGCLALTDLF